MKSHFSTWCFPYGTRRTFWPHKTVVTLVRMSVLCWHLFPLEQLATNNGQWLLYLSGPVGIGILNTTLRWDEKIFTLSYLCARISCYWPKKNKQRASFTSISSTNEFAREAAVSHTESRSSTEQLDHLGFGRCWRWQLVSGVSVRRE